MIFFKSIKTSILDIVNFFRFRKQFKNLNKLNDIEFKSLGLNVNKFGNIVYCQINCTEDDLKTYDYSPLDAVMNKIKPQIDFLCNLGWGDYIVPQINNFVDAEDNDTLSYLIIFMYYPNQSLIRTVLILMMLLLLFSTGIYFLIHGI